jgi:hypothetical protein
MATATAGVTLLGASGGLYCAAVWLAAGTVVTNISFAFTSVAETGTATHGWYTLLDSTFKVLANSADKTSTLFSGTNVVNTLALTSPFTIVTSGIYLIGISISTGGTLPSFVTATGGVGATIKSISPANAVTFSGQAGPPTVGSTLSSPATSAFMAYGYTS